MESHEDASLLPQRTYTVVLRARAAARFLPHERFEASFDAVPRCNGTVRVRLRTRWVDEGYDAPYAGSYGSRPADRRDRWTMRSRFGSFGRLFGNLLAFTANTLVETPEVHIAFDASEGCEEREFVGVFVPDQRGHPSEERTVRTRERTQMFEAVDQLDDARPMDRAIQHYIQKIASDRHPSVTMMNIVEELLAPDYVRAHVGSCWTR